MLMMGAVTTGAVWFRLITGTAILLGLPFDATGPVVVPGALAPVWCDAEHGVATFNLYCCRPRAEFPWPAELEAALLLDAESMIALQRLVRST